jgi:hypothetical protein
MRNRPKYSPPNLWLHKEPAGARLATIKHLDVTRTPIMKNLNTNVSEWNAQQLRFAAIVSSVVTIAWWVGLTLVAQRPVWFW